MSVKNGDKTKDGTKLTISQTVRLYCQQHWDKFQDKFADQDASSQDYHQMHKDILAEILKYHPSMDKINASNAMYSYFKGINKQRAKHNQPAIPLPALYDKSSREKNLFRDANRFYHLHDADQINRQVQATWFAKVVQQNLSLADAFSSLYYCQWVYHRVANDGYCWQQIYQHIIAGKSWLKLGSMLVLALQIPATHYGYRLKMSAADAKGQLATTRYIILDDLGCLWLGYIYRKLNDGVAAPSFEDTMSAFALLTGIQPSKLKSFDKAFVYYGQLIDGSMLDMQMTQTLNGLQKHTGIKVADWQAYHHQTGFLALNEPLTDDGIGKYWRGESVGATNSSATDTKQRDKLSYDVILTLRQILKDNYRVSAFEALLEMITPQNQRLLVQWCLDECRGKLTSSSVRRYLDEVGVLFLHLTDEQNLSTWQTEDFEDIYQEIITQKNSAKPGYTATVLGKLHKTIQGEFKHIEAAYILTSKDALISRAVLISPAMYRHILDVVDRSSQLNTHNRSLLSMIFILLYRTGMRINELLGLKINDFEHATDINGEVHLNIIIRPNENRGIKSEDGWRRLCLRVLLKPDEFKLVYQGFYDACQRKDKCFLTLHDRAGMIDRRWIEPVLRAVLATLPYTVTPHSFRHNAISVMALIMGDATQLLPFFSDYSIKEATAIKQHYTDSSSRVVSACHWDALAEFAGHASTQTSFMSYIHLADLIAAHQLAHARICLPAQLVETVSDISHRAFNDNGHHAYDSRTKQIDLNAARTLLQNRLPKQFITTPSKKVKQPAKPKRKAKKGDGLKAEALPDVFIPIKHQQILQYLYDLQQGINIDDAIPVGMDNRLALSMQQFIGDHPKLLKGCLGDKAKLKKPQYFPVVPIKTQEQKLCHLLFDGLAELYQASPEEVYEFLGILQQGSFIDGRLRFPFKARALVYRFFNIATQLLDASHWCVVIHANHTNTKINQQQEIKQFKDQTGIKQVNAKHAVRTTSYHGFMICHQFKINKTMHCSSVILRHVCFILSLGLGYVSNELSSGKLS